MTGLARTLVFTATGAGLGTAAFLLVRRTCPEDMVTGSACPRCGTNTSMLCTKWQCACVNPDCYYMCIRGPIEPEGIIPFIFLGALTGYTIAATTKIGDF